MRILSIIFLLGSLAAYLLAFIIKISSLNLLEMRPITLIAVAGLNAIIAVAFGVLSAAGKKP